MSASNQINLGYGQIFGQFNGQITFGSGIIYHRTSVSGTQPYTGKATDYILGCNFASGVSGVIVLERDLLNTMVIKDESGTAGQFNITVSGRPNIEGAPSYVLSASGASIMVYPTPYGWRIL
jgi:hypothetical protein